MEDGYGQQRCRQHPCVVRHRLPGAHVGQHSANVAERCLRFNRMTGDGEARRPDGKRKTKTEHEERLKDASGGNEARDDRTTHRHERDPGQVVSHRPGAGRTLEQITDQGNTQADHSRNANPLLKAEPHQHLEGRRPVGQSEGAEDHRGSDNYSPTTQAVGEIADDQGERNPR